MKQSPRTAPRTLAGTLTCKALTSDPNRPPISPAGAVFSRCLAMLDRGARGTLSHRRPADRRCGSDMACVPAGHRGVELIAAAVDGRPGRRHLALSHLQVTSRRCQASSVARRYGDRRRGINRESDASQSRWVGW